MFGRSVDQEPRAGVSFFDPKGKLTAVVDKEHGIRIRPFVLVLGKPAPGGRTVWFKSKKFRRFSSVVKWLERRGFNGLPMVD
tara:strand:+ start:406 stop:651 length:246 start_codon:yes stop_codon:yes gene_type:complete